MRIGKLFLIDRAAIAALFVVIIDQWTKWWAFAATTPGEEINVLPAITISQTRNEGIAFGFFAGKPWLVFGLMAVALIVLLWFYRRHRSRPTLWLATGLLLGGAIGNAIDRIFLGYVRDFIDFPSFPSFNIADVAITCGVIILVLGAEMHAEEPKNDAEDRRDDAQQRTL